MTLCQMLLWTKKLYDGSYSAICGTGEDLNQRRLEHRGAEKVTTKVIRIRENPVWYNNFIFLIVLILQSLFINLVILIEI